MNGGLYLQTNDAERNEVVAFRRAEDGRLERLGRFATGGRGTGVPHLTSQGSVVLTQDGARLLVTSPRRSGRRWGRRRPRPTVSRTAWSQHELARSGTDGARSAGRWPRTTAAHAFTTNFADGAVSRYGVGPDGTIELEDAAAGTTVEGRPGLRDEDLTPDGHYLYAVDADAQRVFGWAVGADGALEPLGSWDGLPATVAGLAAR